MKTLNYYISNQTIDPESVDLEKMPSQILKDLGLHYDNE